MTASFPNPDREAAAGGASLRLTVVIPHYDHIRLLPRSIASVLDQNIEGIEVIVVDDGSDASIQASLDKICAAHPAIRLIRHEMNRGAPAALNTGLAAARGEMISLLGADDLALPGLYRNMIEGLAKHTQAPFACGEIAIVGDDGEIRGVRPLMAPAFSAGYLSPDEVGRRIRHTDNWICNTTVVYRTDALRRAGGFDESLGAFCDGVLVRLLAFEQGFVFQPGLFGVWRIAAETISAQSFLDKDSRDALTAKVLDRLRSPVITHVMPGYPELFARRLRFNAARTLLMWTGDETDPEALAEAAGIGARMLKGIRAAIGYGGFGRTLSLGWIALRLRPFSALHLAMNAVRNQVVKRRHAGRVRAAIEHMELLGRRLTGEKEAA